MSATPIPIVTVEEYLKLDAASENRYEYIDGYIMAMAPPSPNHTLIATNISTAIGTQLKGRDCPVYNSTLRILVESANSLYYPDISIVCGKLKTVNNHGESVLNPIVLIEVLSPSTTYLDTGKKLIHYRRIPTLQEYLVVAQDRYLVGHYFQQSYSEQWDYGECTEPENSVRLDSVNVSIPMREIYDKVVFE